MTVDELLAALTVGKDENPGSGAWEVEANLGPVDVPVLWVEDWWEPEDGNPGRVVLNCDR